MTFSYFSTRKKAPEEILGKPISALHFSERTRRHSLLRRGLRPINKQKKSRKSASTLREYFLLIYSAHCHLADYSMIVATRPECVYFSLHYPASSGIINIYTQFRLCTEALYSALLFPNSLHFCYKSAILLQPIDLINLMTLS